MRFAILLLATAAIAAPARARHVRVVKSEPAAHDTLAASPKTVRLWFSERVEAAVTQAKLRSAGSELSLGVATREDKPDAPMQWTVTKVLAPGAYTIAWSTASKDGHPVKGTLDFVVRAAR